MADSETEAELMLFGPRVVPAVEPATLSEETTDMEGGACPILRSMVRPSLPVPDANFTENDADRKARREGSLGEELEVRLRLPGQHSRSLQTCG